MLNYQILEIQDKHIESFCAAVADVARERAYLGFLEGPSLMMSRAFVRNNLQKNWPHCVAVHDKKVIGWCDITGLDRPIYAHTGVLGMGVIAAHRGQGIGTALIHAALSKAKVHGWTRVQLAVREKNTAAISLYQKAGFVIEGSHRHAVKIESEYENQLSMALLWQ